MNTSRESADAAPGSGNPPIPVTLAVGTDAELPPGLPGIVHVHRTGPYEPYGKGLFLVRPDGYVGWAGEDATGLVDHLARVTG
ncbi:hypothetical protein ABZ611_16420 [Streptomyces sp. NPDC007861]|uniref:aromatic-ring hydroxylase C-terminal domain-containing protein n=1 Tax=Streptomyces sp. NPDC007861 TaxID=3154893 RepID=UPI0033EF5750